MASFAEMKQQALEVASAMNLPHIDELQKSDIPWYYGTFLSASAAALRGINEKVAEVSRKQNAYVYAVIASPVAGDMCLSFLMIPHYEEDWPHMFLDCGNNCFWVYAYVWNMDREWCSECGSVLIDVEDDIVARFA